MTPFDESTGISSGAPGTFDWSVPDGWQQGRGAWGGLVVGALTRSVIASEPDPERLVRSVSVQLTAPVLVGSHRMTVRLIRSGSAMSTWSTTLTDAAGQVLATMVAITGRGRAPGDTDGPIAGVAVPPAIASADECRRIPGGPPFPVFTQHLDMRPTIGMPMDGGAAQTAGWVGFAAPTAATDVSLLALVDAWWPASLPTRSSMPRVATVNFAASLLVDPATIGAGELLVNESYVTSARGGFTSEHRLLWTADGRLAVDNVQAIVIDS